MAFDTDILAKDKAIKLATRKLAVDAITCVDSSTCKKFRVYGYYSMAGIITPCGLFNAPQFT